MTGSEQRRILFVDAYDSFSNNIISLLETSLNAEVTIIKIDTQIENLSVYLKDYVAVVAGPGPGDPRTAEDVGLFRRLWELEGADVIPVLGICLGFQSLVLAHGGGIERLAEPRHGIVRRVSTNGQSIFHGIPSLETVQYHSLLATLHLPDRIGKLGTRQEQSFTVPSGSDMIPLAWDCRTDNNAAQHVHIGALNPDRILMAVRHKRKPLHGIQFHPESISSSSEARQVIRNWWDETCTWRAEALERLDVTLNGLKRNVCNGLQKSIRLPTPRMADIGRTPHYQELQTRVVSKVIDLAGLTVPKICKAVGATQGEAIIFDSEKYQKAETGAFSILGIVESDSMRVEYTVGSSEVHQIRNGEISKTDLSAYNGNIFNFLDAFIKSRKARHNHHRVPFWGGFMGYITYEACLETLGIHEPVRPDFFPKRPDLGFVFVERSIVIDHLYEAVHVQSIKPDDQSWVFSTSSLLSSSSLAEDYASPPQHLHTTISLPDEKQYKSRIRACQASIRAGDSYELCLTNQVNIATPSRLPSWPMYRRLRKINPAPFGAYIRFGNITVLSSSPERFMRWSRPSVATHPLADDSQPPDEECSRLQFRPIKGTIARRPTPNSPPRSLVEAEKLLSTQKERAENLMIADLIRHDLHGVVGSGRVKVPKLMVVEEYETVFQLVTVIEGTMNVERPPKNPREEREEDESSAISQSHLKNGSSTLTESEGSAAGEFMHPKDDDAHKGTRTSHGLRTKPLSPLSALPATLPPGSMTGAPKLRSCQILRTLEAGPRGVYSGILGYMDVGGGGDWSVAIRCAVRFDDPGSDGGDNWRVGAGGAVTALSTEEGEWEEMMAKLQATLRIFHD